MTDAFICDFCGKAKKGSSDVVVKPSKKFGEFFDVKSIVSGIDGSKKELDGCKSCLRKMLSEFNDVEVDQ